MSNNHPRAGHGGVRGVEHKSPPRDNLGEGMAPPRAGDRSPKQPKRGPPQFKGDIHQSPCGKTPSDPKERPHGNPGACPRSDKTGGEKCNEKCGPGRLGGMVQFRGKFRESVRNIMTKIKKGKDMGKIPPVGDGLVDMYGNHVPYELTLSMRSTLHYMKYRETIRRYTGQFRNCNYVTCVAHMLMVICTIFATTLISQHFDSADHGIIEITPDSVAILGLYFDDPNDVTVFVFIGVVFCAINLYVCTHTGIYSNIICLSKMTLKIFYISLPFLLLYNYNNNVSLVDEQPLDKIKAIFNIRAHAIFSKVYYDVLVLTIYISFVLLFNLSAFFYTFIYPYILMYTINEDVKTFKIASYQKIQFDIPQLHGAKGEVNNVPGVDIKLVRTKEHTIFYKIVNKLVNLISFRRNERNANYQYIGELNHNLKPHGFGFWSDSSYHGEMLIGYWENGLPLSQFRSREVGTSSGFCNVNLGWFEFCGNEIYMGISTAECCVSGPFFRTFPRVMRYYSGPASYESASVLKYLGSWLMAERVDNGIVSSENPYITKNSVVLNLGLVSNDIIGYRYGNAKHRLRKNKVGLKLDTDKATVLNAINNMECILCALTIHTPHFAMLDKSSLEISLDPTSGLEVKGYSPNGNLGYCNEVKIVVEGTPKMDAHRHISDCIKVQGWSKREGTKNVEAWIYIHGFNSNCVESLSIFGQILAFGNYPQYIKPFVFCWPSGHGILQFRSGVSTSSSSKTINAFIIMLQSLIANGIRDVHIMTHSMGARMFLYAFNDIVNSKNNHLFKPLESQGSTNQMRLLTVTLLNPYYPVKDFVDKTYPLLRKYCTHITIYSDLQDKALLLAEILTWKKRLGRCIADLYVIKGSEAETPQPVKRCTLGSIVLPFSMLEESKQSNENNTHKEWLDVDVIDTTFLGSNIHFIRHAYWFLNREIIEDLRELIVNRRRADQRTSRLDRGKGNAWIYRVPPSNLNTIFETIF